MTVEHLLALAGYSVVSSITPGPNNLMLLASGVNHGFRRSIPHMLGISGGFAFLLACVGFGIGQLLTLYPPLHLVLKAAGGLYLIYLAWRIATSGPIGKGNADTAAVPRPMSFLEAALFQWVNPKAWMMAVFAMSVYTLPEAYFHSVILVVLVFTLLNLPSIAIWCGMGLGLRNLLSDPARLRIFNWFMAALLVATLWPMLR